MSRQTRRHVHPQSFQEVIVFVIFVRASSVKTPKGNNGSGVIFAMTGTMSYMLIFSVLTSLFATIVPPKFR